MRVIADVTLFYLPGTFVATLFSASFWDFSPDNVGKVFSKWIWLYVGASVWLTVAVMGIWRVLPQSRIMRFR